MTCSPWGSCEPPGEDPTFQTPRNQPTMPTYDYECRSCGKSFEYFQSISDAPKTRCPACGADKLARLIGTGAGFLFKGSGFHCTDYRSAGYKARAKADSGSSSTSSTSSGVGGSSGAKGSSGTAK